MKEFIKKIKSEGFKLSVQNNRLILNGLTGKLSSEQVEAVKNDNYIIDYIKKNKEELIKYVLLNNRKNSKKIDKNDISAFYELSPLQEGILFHSLYNSKSTTYKTQYNMEFLDGLNLDAFEKAWANVIKNHTILRTAFVHDELSIPVQFIYKRANFTFNIIDHSQYNDETHKEKFEVLLKEDRIKEFDLRKPPLMRVTIVKLNTGAHKMIWTKHHILWDGWSGQILIGEVLSAYVAYVKEREPLVIKEDKYEDYIKYIKNINPEKEKKFWKGYLKDFNQNSLLPFSSVTSNRNNGEGVFKKTSLKVDESLTERIVSFSKKIQVTPSTLLQGVWSVLISKYTGSNDIVFGVTVSGRPADIKYNNKVGLFINTLPFRCKFNREDSIQDLFTRLQKSHVEAREYQYTAINDIKNWSNVKGDFFDSILVFNNFPVGGSTDSSSENAFLRIGDIHVQENSNFMLSIQPNLGKKLIIDFAYNSSLLSGNFLEMIKGHFFNILSQVVEDEQKKVSSLNVLTEIEKVELLSNFNSTDVIYTVEKNLAILFQDQVRKTPDNIALVFEEKNITYQELDKLSDRLAACLRDKFEVKAGDIAGLYLDRSEWVIIAMLGVLKSGGAFVPIDPELPDRRKQYYIKNSRCKIIITQSNYLLEINDYDGSIFNIETQFEQLENEAVPLNLPRIPSDLAYIIYTSGSTGNPKGVMIEQKAIVNTILTQIKKFDIEELDKVLQFASFSFDASISEIFTTLLSGASLHIIGDNQKKDPRALEEYLVNQKITIATLSPSILQLIDVFKLKNLKKLITAGESAVYDQVLGFIEFGNYCNAYGPTESSICATAYDVKRKGFLPSKNIPIGKPISNTQIYIVDQDYKLVPKGVLGEILIAGEGLARGYINNPKLTAEKFIVNPFKRNELVYKTGDIGKWLFDGNIEFVGRKDDQVKIRGYRIEIGEIEQTLRGFELLEEVAVIIKKNSSEENELVAYITSKGKPNTSELRNFLKERIPDYMLPTHFIQLEMFPLTISGKIDKKSLIKEQCNSLSSGLDYVAPRNEIEKELIMIWQKTLNVEKVGINDDFFTLGGHSLKVTQLISEYHKAFDVKLGLKVLFDNPTLLSHSNIIQSSSKIDYEEISAIKEAESYPVSDAQKRLWILSQFGNGSEAYNIQFQVELPGEYEIETFAKAIHSTIERHEILRTVFKEDESGELRQWILPKEKLGFVIDYKDYRTKLNKTELLQEFINKTSSQLFDLENGPLFRICIIQLADEKLVFYLNMHHIISDGRSMEVLNKDVLSYYNHYRESDNVAVDLARLSIQYKDYVVWLKNELKEENLEPYKEYWSRIFNKGIPQITFPFEKKRPENYSYNGSAIVFNLGRTLKKGFEKISIQNDGTLFMSLLFMVKILIHKYTGNERIMVGSSFSTRIHPDLENQIGFYVNNLPLVSEINENLNIKDFYFNVKENLLNVLKHRLYPLESVIDQVDYRYDKSKPGLFNVLVEYHRKDNNDITKINDNSFSEGEVILLRESTSNKFDIAIEFIDTGKDLTCLINYNKDLFDHKNIDLLRERMVSLSNKLISTSNGDLLGKVRDFDFRDHLVIQENLDFATQENF